MRYVGLDVHAKSWVFVVLNNDGKKIRTCSGRGSWDDLLGQLAEINRPFSICYEASTGYGYLYDRLCSITTHIEVAHPGHLRLIFRARKKNDRVDALKLAKLLYLNEVPPVYVPSAAIREWRQLILHRQSIVQTLVRTKNQIRALLRRYGLSAPKHTWSQRGLKVIEAQPLPEGYGELQRDLLLEQLGATQLRLTRVERALTERAARDSRIGFLMTIPGIGVRTAEAVVAYIDDPRRFRKRSVGSYFGLVPRQDASGANNRLGHITREGPSVVRKLLTQATWQAISRSAKIRARFEQYCHGNRERRKIALVATAHHLIRVMHSMLLTGEACRYAEAA